jgi:hypothetical protein
VASTNRLRLTLCIDIIARVLEPEKGDGLYTSKPFGGPLQRLVFLREAEAQHRRSG